MIYTAYIISKILSSRLLQSELISLQIIKQVFLLRSVIRLTGFIESEATRTNQDQLTNRDLT